MKAGKSSKRVREKSPPVEEVAATQETGIPSTDTVVLDPALPDAGQDAVVLVPECTARNADALRADLLGRLDAAAEVIVETGAVERIDTACLQLLCAFVRDRTRHGRTTAWRGRSDVLAQAVALLGVGGTLPVSDAT